MTVWPGQIVGDNELLAPITPVQRPGQPAPSGQPQPNPQFPGSEVNPGGMLEPEKVGGFFDELPTQPATSLAPEDEAELIRILTETPTATAASDARRFVASKGFTGNDDNFDSVIKARDEGQGVVNTIDYKKMKMRPEDGAVGATARGAADTLTVGAYPRLQALANTLGAGDNNPNIANSDLSFGDIYDRNLDMVRGVQDADETDHGTARVIGQLVGGLGVPLGMEGVAYKAGKEALRAGLTMQEARAIALHAATTRLAQTSGAYGAAHGALSAETVPEAFTGALTEGSIGALGGLALGKAGEKIVPRLSGRGVSSSVDLGRIAQEQDIPATPATVGGTGAEVSQMVLGNLPGGSNAVIKGAEAETQGLGDAARRVAESVGTPSTRQGAGEALAKGTAAYERATKARGGALYRARDAAFGGQDAPVSVDQARATLSDFSKKFPSSPAIEKLNEHPVVRRIAGVIGEDAVATDDGLITLAEATEALSHVRGVKRNLAAKSDVSGVVLSRVSKLEQALEDDVMNAAKAADQAAGGRTGAGSAVQAQKDADAYWAERSKALNGSLEGMKKSSKDDIAFSGEQVFNRLYADTARKGGNLKRLRDTWFRLPKNAKRTFAATAIDDMGRATSGAQNDLGTEWSFNTFLTNYDKMSPQARNIILGGDASKQLADIAKYASRMRDIDKSRNFSNTARNAMYGALGAVVGRALWHGDIVGAAETAAAVPAAWGAAKVFLATPTMRNWTKAALKIADAPAGQQKGATEKLITGLTKIARADPAIANEVLNLQQRLIQAVSGSAPARLAADEPLDASTGIQVKQDQENQQAPKP